MFWVSRRCANTISIKRTNSYDCTTHRSKNFQGNVILLQKNLQGNVIYVSKYTLGWSEERKNKSRGLRSRTPKTSHEKKYWYRLFLLALCQMFARFNCTTIHKFIVCKYRTVVCGVFNIFPLNIEIFRNQSCLIRVFRRKNAKKYSKIKKNSSWSAHSLHFRK